MEVFCFLLFCRIFVFLLKNFVVSQRWKSLIIKSNAIESCIFKHSKILKEVSDVSIMFELDLRTWLFVFAK